MTNYPNLTAKYREIVGHEEGCPEYRYLTEPQRRKMQLRCTCPPPSVDELVAVVFGDLRKEHLWTPDGCSYCPDTRESCVHCDQDFDPEPPGDDERHPGPCAPPIDAARRWRMLEAVVDSAPPSQRDVPIHQIRCIEDTFLTLAEAGMLKEGK